MKKLIFSLLAVLGIVSTNAQASYDSYSFLNGWHVVITNNSTVLYGATNVAYADAGNTNLEYSLTNTYYLAYQNNGTAYWTNNLLTNANISGFAPAWKDTPTWSDRNGNTPTDVSLQVVITGDDANATNLVTFTFQKLAYGGQNIGQGNPPRAFNSLTTAETTAANNLVFTMNGNGATPVCLITNLTSTFFGGCGGLRLKSVVTSNSYTNTYLQTIALTGFSP